MFSKFKIEKPEYVLYKRGRARLSRTAAQTHSLIVITITLLKRH